MSAKNIKEHGNAQLLLDLKKVRDVLAYTPASSSYLRVAKKDVLKEAESTKIEYYITDKLFVVKRDVIIII